MEKMNSPLTNINYETGRSLLIPSDWGLSILEFIT